MDPSYIFFGQLDIDEDNTFTENISEENEIENVVFNKDNKYAITGLNINSIFSDSELLKIENIKEQNRVFQEIKDLINGYNEPDLTFVVSHPETKIVEVPFVKKKNESDLPKTELTYYNPTTPQK